MSEGKKLQWIKGDKVGKVETVMSIDEEGWLTFVDGGRISSDLVGEFMIDATDGVLEIDDLSYRTPHQPNQHQDSYTQDVQHVKESPLMSLLKKMSKTQSTALGVTINVEVPLSSMYNVLIDSFDEEEVHKEISTYILNQVNDKLIKESVQASVDDIIQNLK